MLGVYAVVVNEECERSTPKLFYVVLLLSTGKGGLSESRVRLHRHLPRSRCLQMTHTWS